MKIEIVPITESDFEEFEVSGMDAKACLDGRIKLLCQDENGNKAESYIKQEEIERFGVDYIQNHAYLEHFQACNMWIFRYSKNDWYNDETRNPARVIELFFCGIEEGTGREIYKGIKTKRYYLREVYTRQSFSKWYVCGSRRTADDGSEPRPNLIFKFGEETEKVIYNDWNGVAAYKDQFNPHFR